MAKNKERLKQKIVARKYFKETEPRFLTFAEKELIHTLYESNPQEWPIERLSESFPALPETIQKILRAKWSPRSVESVIRYDNIVIENWKKFHMGKLPLNPILSQHLTKFKDRKIIMTDRESLARRFVLLKPEFKKPKNQLFSNIIQTYLDKKQGDTKLSQGNNFKCMSDASSHCDKDQNRLIEIGSSPMAVNNLKTFVLNKETDVTSRSQMAERNNELYNKKNIKQPLTFNEFIKAELKDMSKLPTEEGIALLEVCKEQINAQETRDTEVAVASDNAVTDIGKDFTVSDSKDCDSDIVVADDNLVDTHIKLWRKKVETEFHYINPIKIAKNVYKPGMTYRIGDCYYDDDGEFLYRIPGVRN